LEWDTTTSVAKSRRARHGVEVRMSRLGAALAQISRIVESASLTTPNPQEGASP